MVKLNLMLELLALHDRRKRFGDRGRAGMACARGRALDQEDTDQRTNSRSESSKEAHHLPLSVLVEVHR